MPLKTLQKITKVDGMVSLTFVVEFSKNDGRMSGLGRNGTKDLSRVAECQSTKSML